MIGIANIISVAAAAAASGAVTDVDEKRMKTADEEQKCCLVNRYDHDRLKHYVYETGQPEHHQP